MLGFPGLGMETMIALRQMAGMSALAMERLLLLLLASPSGSRISDSALAPQAHPATSQLSQGVNVLKEGKFWNRLQWKRKRNGGQKRGQGRDGLK